MERKQPILLYNNVKGKKIEMKIRMFRFIWIALMAVCLQGCDNNISEEDVDLDDIFSTESMEDEQQEKDAMKVIGVNFTTGYKQFTLQTGILRDLGPYALTDTSQVTIKATESVGGRLNETMSKPVLVEVRNSEADEVAKKKIKVLVLVDLAQPQHIVDEERNAVAEIRAVFARDNLFVSFMYGMNVTETMEATDYVLNTYFKTQPDQYKYLYRSLLLKKREMADRTGVWSDAKKLELIVFSDEKVYGENDRPIDPQHFELQGTLVRDTLTNDSLSISSVCFKPKGGILDDDEAKSVLKVVCKNSDGIYMDQFNWTKLKENVLHMDGQMILANEFVFENPDGKVYRGDPHTMRIEIYAKDTEKMIGSATSSIYLGTAYNPVIVNGGNNIWMFIQGIVTGLLMMLFVYLVFQFLIPFIQYKLFERKYVLKYVPGNMSIGNVLITESCYFCKARFMEGDTIVAKCEHVMHKSCWDENDHHCPEFGRRCKDGSHYYNDKNLFDPKNASFYMKWILVAMVASICTWFIYMVYVTDYDAQTQQFVAKMMEPKIGMTGEMAMFNGTSDYLDFIPAFGLLTGFFFTLALSSLAVRRMQLRRRLLDVVLRALIVGVVAFLIFRLFRSISLAFSFVGVLSSVMDCVPWILTALLIVFVSTVGTRIKLKKYVLAIAIGLAVLSMYMWSILFRDITQMDIRVLLLFSIMFLSVGLAVSVAELAPKSEHYFLNIKGAVKEMDVALFKWFMNNLDDVVTIGKSIDCSLQMSWDIKGLVAPINAELRMVGDGVRLTAVEDGVRVGDDPLPAGRSVWLYHNTQFSIGDTTFTYVERDI